MPHAYSDEELHQRRMKSLELRRKGYSYYDIKKELEKNGWFVSAVQVHADCHLYMRQRIKEQADEVEFNRQIELDRLDVALKAIMPRIEIGDDDAIQTMLKIQIRRAKLLGLDTPIKKVIEDNREVRGKKTREELLASLQEMTQKLAAYAPKELPDITVTVESVPETTQSAGQTANDISGDFEENERE